ncbi:MAG: hypothetical protein AAFZ15_28985 [Bacteroidota bacterium]
MKRLIFLFLLISAFGCKDNLATLSYDESKQGAILSKDLNKSAEDNIKDHLSLVGANYSKVKITSLEGSKCGCAKFKSNCYCNLKNTQYANAKNKCTVSNSECTAEKIIKIKVAPEDVEKFASTGFK